MQLLLLEFKHEQRGPLGADHTKGRSASDWNSGRTPGARAVQSSQYGRPRLSRVLESRAISGARRRSSVSGDHIAPRWGHAESGVRDLAQTIQVQECGLPSCSKRSLDLLGPLLATHHGRAQSFGQSHALEHGDELITTVALLASDVDQLLHLGDHYPPLRSARHPNRPAPPHLY